MSKRHNTVHLGIRYKNANDRTAFEAELNLIQELTMLMTAAERLHEHGSDPIVRPQAYVKDVDDYYGSIDLKFPIYSSWTNDEDVLRGYSYTGLYSLLKLLSEVCAKHAPNFEEFNTTLNLEGMKAPWVLPVVGNGVILRAGARQISFSGTLLPRSVMLSTANLTVDQMIVVGEPRAVEEFRKAWVFVADRYKHTLDKHPGHPYTGSGPTIYTNSMKITWPDISWHNIGVFARVRQAESDPFWVDLCDMHNSAALNTIVNVGNHMLNTPLMFSNTDPASCNNIFLSDHAYYSFESVL